jgi:hypothetical protein
MRWLFRITEETTLYWSPPVSDGLGGLVWDEPIEIKGRWQYGSNRRGGPMIQYSQDSSVLSSRSVFWTLYPVVPRAYVFRGSIASLPDDFNIDEQATQIISIGSVRPLYGDEFLYKSYLDET